MSKCNGCIYWRRFCGHGENTVNACHYILDTGKKRGCDPAQCTKKKTAEAGEVHA